MRGLRLSLEAISRVPARLFLVFALAPLSAGEASSGAIRSTREQCPEVDLRPALGPVRQQTSDWCVGFAVADVLSFHTGRRVSATDLSLFALVRQREWATEVVESTDEEVRARCESGRIQTRLACGDVVRSHREERKRVRRELARPLGNRFVDWQAAIDGARARGLCSESDVSSENFGPSPGRLGTWNRAGEMNEIVRHFTWLHEEARALPEGEVLCADSPAMTSLRRVFPAAAQTGMWQMTNIMRDPRFLEILQTGACETRFAPEPSDPGRTLEFDEHDTGDGGSLNEASLSAAMARRALRQALDERRPVVIGYDARFMGGAAGFLATLGKPLPHASVLAGRRWNESKGACEYIIRNSWGPDCSRYRSTVGCEDGNLIVDEDTLFANTEAIFDVRSVPRRR